MDSCMLRQQLTTLTNEAFHKKFQILFGSSQTAWQVLYPTLDLTHAFLSSVSRHYVHYWVIVTSGAATTISHHSCCALGFLSVSCRRHFSGCAICRARLCRIRFISRLWRLRLRFAVRAWQKNSSPLQTIRHQTRVPISGAGCRSDNLPARTLYEKFGFVYQKYRQIPCEVFGFPRFDHLICPL